MFQLQPTISTAAVSFNLSLIDVMTPRFSAFDSIGTIISSLQLIIVTWLHGIVILISLELIEITVNFVGITLVVIFVTLGCVGCFIMHGIVISNDINNTILISYDWFVEICSAPGNAYRWKHLSNSRSA